MTDTKTNIKKYLLGIALVFGFISMQAQEEDTVPYNYSELFGMPYCGYSLEYNKSVSHGLSFGYVMAVNHFMLGCDFKISAKEPKIDNYNYGGYAIIGFQHDFMAMGALLGGAAIYGDYTTKTYLDFRYPDSQSYDYKSTTKFDGGIMVLIALPTDSYVGAGLMISSTFYSPFNISLGIYFQDY